jgi:hypothetical protein
MVSNMPMATRPKIRTSSAQAAMHQHFVNDHLEEQRRNQREELEEEGCGQHFGEHPPVLANSAHEPGEVEAARKVRQARAARHKDKAAAPDGLELLPRHRLGPRLHRALHQHLVGSGSAEDEEAKAPAARHRDRPDGAARCTVALVSEEA